MILPAPRAADFSHRYAGRRLFHIRLDDSGRFKAVHYESNNWERRCADAWRPSRATRFWRRGIALASRSDYASILFQAGRRPSGSKHGVHELPDDTAAQIAAIELARSVREVRPELIGQRYTISVSNDLGTDVCVIPLEIP